MTYTVLSLPKNLKYVVYMDKTFRLINQKWFELILAINSSRDVFGWQLNRVRSVGDITLAIEPVFANLG